MDIYTLGDDAPLALGDKLRSIERGDTVRVVELGKRLADGGELPTVRLESVSDPEAVPFEPKTVTGEYGCYLSMYRMLKRCQAQPAVPAR